MALEQTLDKLAAFEPTGFPFISLYLNMQPNEQGRDDFAAFVRKQVTEISESYGPRTSDRESFERDAARIQAFLDNELDESANGAALFACGGADFFEAVQLDAPIERHRIAVADRPDIYPLARLIDQYPTYAAALVDSNRARIFVFGLGSRITSEDVAGVKTNRSMVGGWSQARYQRHVDNIHMHHLKDVAEALDRIVNEEQAEHVILAGDEQMVKALRDHLSQPLLPKVLDIMRLDVRTPEQDVMTATLERMRQWNTEADAEKVEQLMNEFRAGNLGVVGVQATRRALELGQVDELIISAARETVKGAPVKDKAGVRAIETPAVAAAAVASGTPEVTPETVAVTDELVTYARQTAARVTFIEDPQLLAGVGGVGALLRFKL